MCKKRGRQIAGFPPPLSLGIQDILQQPQVTRNQASISSGPNFPGSAFHPLRCPVQPSCSSILMQNPKRNSGLLSKGMDPTASHSNGLTTGSCSHLLLWWQGFNMQHLSGDIQSFLLGSMRLPVWSLKHRDPKKTVFNFLSKSIPNSYLLKMDQNHSHHFFHHRPYCKRNQLNGWPNFFAALAIVDHMF